MKRVPEGKEKGGDHILALNRHGVHFIDLITHVSSILTFFLCVKERRIVRETNIEFLGNPVSLSLLRGNIHEKSEIRGRNPLP